MAGHWMAWGLSAAMWVASPVSVAGGGYVGLGTGIVYAPNERFDETPVLLDYDLGFRVGTLTLGYRFDGGWRAELEAAYRRNGLEIIEFDDERGLINTGLSDAVDTASLMVNALYEFDLGLSLRPYVGIGLGLARVDYELSEYGTGAVILDDSETAFAYQFLVGVGVPLGRRFHLSADYRYWRNVEIDLHLETGEPVSSDHPV
ncbi:MAG: porin family protein, partial [Gammaproteobacteria bacterium]|nr:porin family protein [Gammaproteobacteria bacterium]